MTSPLEGEVAGIVLDSGGWGERRKYARNYRMPYHPNRDRSRELRSNMTAAEKFVWERVRRERFGVKFRRQHPLGPFIVDFVCLERKLVLELDGGQHAEPERAEYDAHRSAWLKGKGYRVYRLWNGVAVSEWDGVAERIWRLLDDVSADPDACA